MATVLRWRLKLVGSPRLRRGWQALPKRAVHQRVNLQAGVAGGESAARRRCVRERQYRANKGPLSRPRRLVDRRERYIDRSVTGRSGYRRFAGQQSAPPCDRQRVGSGTGPAFRGSASAAVQLFFQEVLNGIEQLHTVLFQVDVVGALTKHDELFGGCLRQQREEGLSHVRRVSRSHSATASIVGTQS